MRVAVTLLVLVAAAGAALDAEAERDLLEFVNLRKESMLAEGSTPDEAEAWASEFVATTVKKAEQDLLQAGEQPGYGGNAEQQSTDQQQQQSEEAQPAPDQEASTDQQQPDQQQQQTEQKNDPEPPVVTPVVRDLQVDLQVFKDDLDKSGRYLNSSLNTETPQADKQKNLLPGNAELDVTAEPVPTMVFPDTFQFVLETDILLNGVLQDVVINITSALAPLGAEQLYKLLKVGFYDGACIFRVVPNFVVQWGIAADPELTKDWSVPIPDDPVEVSNEEGTFVFATAGKDTRTTQVFVNMRDNPLLDIQGFSPLGQVVQGMDALKAAYNPTPGKPGGVDQGKYTRQGNAWLKPKVPKINQIVRAFIKEEHFA